ncbi:MAG TPA: ABC transporter ATP-binding protein [Alphaproteobacteria bacterium]|nr:ABC transporter ATP-binding protein [Alphaproteobacteria bacterium]
MEYGVGAGRHRVLSGIELEVARGSFVSIIGPSGCGKSTLLRVLAGLVAPSAGAVAIAGLSPADAVKRRLIGLVFQDANLLPWKSALDNAAFLLEVSDRRLKRAETRARALEILKLVGLERAAGRRPSQLSGGMRQRVSIARALALDPEILLMDEPFGALDAITREEMSYFLLDLWQRTRKTVVFVTHSIDEAVFLSSRVHVMGVGPARILDTIDVPLAYPRTEACFEDPAFARTEARLRALLLEGHGKGSEP